MASSTLRWLLFGLLLLAANTVYAEGNCPPGYYPTGAPQGQAGPQGCAPIPGHNNQQQSQEPSPPPPKWATRWGAIATDFSHNAAGASFNQLSKGEAILSAIDNCRENGGILCKIEITYFNQCVAMLGGKDGHVSYGAPTIEEAIRLSKKSCTDAGDTTCQVLYTSCSLPERIQ